MREPQRAWRRWRLASRWPAGRRRGAAGAAGEQRWQVLYGTRKRRLRRCQPARSSTLGASRALSQERGSKRAPPVPDIVRGITRHHLNAHLIRAGRKVFADPLPDVALGSPGHEPFGEPLAAVTREVFLLEALAEPTVAVVGQLQVAAQVGAG